MKTIMSPRIKSEKGRRNHFENNKLERRKKVMGYFFLIPSFFFLAVFLIYPMIKSMVMSFTDWNGFNPDYQWVGLKNYVNLFTDTPA